MRRRRKKEEEEEEEEERRRRRGGKTNAQSCRCCSRWMDREIDSYRVRAAEERERESRM